MAAYNQYVVPQVTAIEMSKIPATAMRLASAGGSRGGEEEREAMG
jgi:hypothetical protein